MIRVPHSLLLATFALTVCGCSQSYNGAFGLKVQDKHAAAEYQKFKEERDRQLQVHELKTAQVQYDQPQSQQQLPGAKLALASVPGATPSNQDAATAAAVYAANAANPTMRPLGMYGQLPATAAGNSSPLDGLDNLRRVSFATEGADFDPDIDPAGLNVVFSSTRHRQTSDVYLTRVGGTAVTQLTNDPANDVMPAFSPDGKQVAFASDRGGNWDIYLMDISGGGAGQAIQLTSDPTHEMHPSFSPDGGKLVYCSYGAQSGQWELVVIDVANPAQRRFIGFGLFPNWSPISSTIVFQRARERGTRWFSVWTVEYQDGEASRPTEVAASSNAACITPDWSPDGKHIVFCTVLNPQTADQTQPVQADVWMVNADGSARSNLTASPFANLQPVWSRDGSIYFVSNRGQGGVDNIWAMSPQRAIAVAQAAGRPVERAAELIVPVPAPPLAPLPPAPAATAEVPTP